jgi:hypothetical protein
VGTLLADNEIGLSGKASSQICAELRRIYRDLHLGAKNASLLVIIADLERLRIITPPIADLTRRLLLALDAAEKGRSLEPQQIEIIRDKGPGLIRVLKSVPS